MTAAGDGGAVSGAAVVDRPQLHLPEEPLARRVAWRDAVLEGTDLDDVLVRVEGWLWARWRILETAGIDRAAFTLLVTRYRRELWLWLAGERTWEQCCSGLLGRINRRIPG
jgi:hypothetical protein